jgi:hypothetical protein
MNVNLSTLLDVALSLVFVFFVFSLFVSGLVEFINGLVEKRAALFQAAMDKLLGTRQAEAFFRQGIVAIKEEKRRLFKRPISYLSGDSFSTALVALLVEASGESPQTTEATLRAVRTALGQEKFNQLRTIIEPILHKIDTFASFKHELEVWYAGYMEQVSGWFKQYTQRIVWTVSILVTLLLNVDTIRITKQLYADPRLRDSLVNQAIAASQQRAYADSAAFRKFLEKQNAPPGAFRPQTLADTVQRRSFYVQYLKESVQGLGIPMGWKTELPLGQQWTAWSLVGWALTAAALSFGAPFWFDLLVKIVNIRNTARRPEPPGKPKFLFHF